jgi:PAS domain S-box-containing protein
MAETPAADVAVMAARAAYDRLHQQATTPGLASAALQALLAEALNHLQGVLCHPALLAEGAPRAADKYQALFNSLDEGVCLFELLYDAQGAPVDYRFLEVNPAFAQQTGLHEAPGQLGSDLTPGTEAHWLDTYAHVLQTGEPVRFEHHHQGTARWYEVYASRVGGAGSRQVCTVFNDVTARRQAAEQQQFLLQLSDLLRPLADPLAIQQTALHFVAEHLGLDRLLYNEIDPDVTTYIVRASYVREGFLAYGGVQPMGPFTESVRALQQGVTKVVYDVETDDSFSPAEKAICAGIQVRAFVVVPLLKNGRWVLNLVAHSSRPRPWPPHELALLAETAERTWAAAERARAEEALRRSEEQFRTVANLVPDLLWRAEPDGATSWYNQRWLDYTGQTLAEAAGDGWTDVIHPDDRVRSAHYYHEAVSTGQPLRQEHRLRSARGEYRWFVVIALPARDAQGTITQWFGSATDIEAQKQAEATLRTFATALEAQVAARTHELQASEADNLQLRLAQQQRLFEAVLEAQEAERKRIAEGLHNGIGQLLYATKLRLDALHAPLLGTYPELVRARREADQLLAEAIRQTRTLSHELVPTVLTDFGLELALTDIARNLSSPQLYVHCSVELAEVPPLPQLLQVALYRIAQELLQNVVKHARATQASLALEAVPGFVLLRVEDNGIGFVPAATVPAGLGMRTIRSRVALLQGTLEQGSSPAYGTYVRLRIPLPPLASVPRAAPALPPA